MIRDAHIDIAFISLLTGGLLLIILAPLLGSLPATVGLVMIFTGAFLLPFTTATDARP